MSAGCTDAVRTPGLGTWVTGRIDGGSDGGRTASFGGGSGTVRATDLRIVVVGGTGVLRSVCVGWGGSTGAVRAIGLGMMNAGFVRLGTSTALR